ncbi:MAG: hypothetical protein ACMG6H_14805 [Acidobacteriota bacterium]
MNSSLATIWAPTPSVTRFSLTSGVLPISSVILAAIFNDLSLQVAHATIITPPGGD